MSNQGYYDPPSGPPPGNNGQQSNNPFASQQQPSGQFNQAGYQAPSGGPPRRTNTFKETDFVPETQRGEQREMMEHFEMNRSKPENETDRDVATLQGEFPAVDGSLIAALYGDSGSLSATREMLHELGDSSAGK